MTSRMQQRRDTAANWTSNNPTLAAGEIGIETDTKKMKVGDGTTAWNSLTYAATGTVTGVTAGTGLTGGTISTSGTIAIDSTVVTLTGTQTISNKTLTAPVITQGASTPSFTSNAYTVVAGDAGLFLLASNSTTAGTIYIPTDATTNFAQYTQIHIQQTGSGQLTIAAATPATTTITSNGSTTASPKLRGQYSVATLYKTAANTWTVYGDIA